MKIGDLVMCTDDTSGFYFDEERILEDVHLDAGTIGLLMDQDGHEYDIYVGSCLVRAVPYNQVVSIEH